MPRLLPHILPRCIFAGLIALATTAAVADTVVTRDGRWLVGDVQKTDSGYVVHTAKGPVEVPTAEVMRILASKKSTPVASEAPPPAAVDHAQATSESTHVPAAPNRQQVLSLAADAVAEHRPMKAVKYIKTYLDAHPTPPDEAVIDALGIALSQAEGVKGGLYVQAVDLFNHQTIALEETRPGQKRWGIEWKPAADVDDLMQKRQKAQQAIDAAAADLSRINQGIATAQRQKASLSWGLQSPRQRTDAEQRISKQLTELQQEQSKAQDAYTQALSKMVKPDFPKTINPADLESVASAGETQIPALTKPSPAHHASEDSSTTSDQPADSTDSPPPPLPPESIASTEPHTPLPPRHVTHYAAAFAVAPGLAVTSAATVAGAVRLELQTADGGSLKGQIVRVDNNVGLALVKFTGGRVANLVLADRASAGAVQCIGYPDVDLFNPKPQVMQGAVAAESKQWEARFEDSPRLPGAPLLQNGEVVGVVLGDRDTDPAHVPAVTPEAIKDFLKDDAHPSPIATDPTAAVMQIVATK